MSHRRMCDCLWHWLFFTTFLSIYFTLGGSWRRLTLLLVSHGYDGPTEDTLWTETVNIRCKCLSDQSLSDLQVEPTMSDEPSVSGLNCCSSEIRFPTKLKEVLSAAMSLFSHHWRFSYTQWLNWDSAEIWNWTWDCFHPSDIWGFSCCVTLLFSSSVNIDDWMSLSDVNMSCLCTNWPGVQFCHSVSRWYKRGASY